MLELGTMIFSTIIKNRFSLVLCSCDKDFVFPEYFPCGVMLAGDLLSDDSLKQKIHFWISSLWIGCCRCVAEEGKRDSRTEKRLNPTMLASLRTCSVENCFARWVANHLRDDNGTGNDKNTIRVSGCCAFSNTWCLINRSKLQEIPRPISIVLCSVLVTENIQKTSEI